MGAVFLIEAITVLGRHPGTGVLLRDPLPGHNAAHPDFRRSQHGKGGVAQLIAAAFKQSIGVDGGGAAVVPLRLLQAAAQL